uniref:BTB domain-containing protein n=1 Tax=Panagrellus redivivus TaxID=6233 RepID=A0A7E4VCI2_PANRE
MGSALSAPDSCIVTHTVTLQRNTVYKSGFRKVSGAPELTWILDVYPLGVDNKSDKVEALLWIIGGGTTTVLATFEFVNKRTHNFNPQIYNEENSKRSFLLEDNKTLRSSDSISTIICTFELRSEVLPPPLKVHELIDISKEHSWNVKLVMGENYIKAHRGFLSMISPVFHAMFVPGTKESKTGIVEIKDLSYVTVKNALRYCYGGDPKDRTLAQLIDMLRFYDKYDIQAPIKKLELWLANSLSVKNFAPIASYSWQFDRVHLQRKCGQVFHLNKTELACHPTFVALGATTIAGVLKAGHAYATSHESLIPGL